MESSTHFIWWEFINNNFLTLLLTFIPSLLCSVYAYNWMKRYLNLPPGPIGLPLVGYLPFISKEPHKAFANLKKKYGDIFGLYLGYRYTVIISDIDIAKEVLCHPSALARPEASFDFIPEGLGFTSLSGKEWMEQRRFFVQTMRNIGMGKGKWESLVKEELDSFTDDLRKHKGEPIDFAEPLFVSLMNNMWSLATGKRHQKDETDKVKILLDFENTIMELVWPLSASSLFPWITKFLVLFRMANYEKYLQIMLKYNHLVREEIENHKTSKEDKSSFDFIDHYISEAKTRNPLDKGTFTEKDLVGSITSLLLGGTDTNWSSLTFLLLLMAEYPDIQRKVQKEIHEAIGRDGEPKWEERGQFPLTLAVMAEMERWATIINLSLSRRSSEEFIVRSYTIPKETLILINNHVINHDPKHWKDPFEFRPERFLSKDGKEYVKSDEYNVFSFGKRICPGENVALVNIFLYFTTLLQKFTIKSPTKVNFHSEGYLRITTIPVKQALQFIPRE